MPPRPTDVAKTIEPAARPRPVPGSSTSLTHGAPQGDMVVVNPAPDASVPSISTVKIREIKFVG